MTVNGLLATFLFKHGAFVNKKCPVQPESTMAVSLLLIRGGVRQLSNGSLLFLDVAPRSQSPLTWDPPMLFILLASRLCPYLGYKQVWLVWVHASL
jgi:hypothetical protein